MSTIKTDTLQNVAGTKSVPVNTVVDGSAKAWVNFNGTGTVAIRAAFNVSSITDNGTGSYTVNFTAALPDANYCIQISSDATVSNNMSNRHSTITSASAQVTHYESGDTITDATYMHVVIFR